MVPPMSFRRLLTPTTRFLAPPPHRSCDDAGLFAYLNGVISCTKKELALALAMRFVVAPLINVPIMYLFKMRGTLMKIMILQSAMPQGTSSFVLFKEARIRPEVFSTSLVVGTALCLPITCIWCVGPRSFEAHPPRLPRPLAAASGGLVTFRPAHSNKH